MEYWFYSWNPVRIRFSFETNNNNMYYLIFWCSGRGYHVVCCGHSLLNLFSRFVKNTHKVEIDYKKLVLTSKESQSNSIFWKLYLFQGPIQWSFTRRQMMKSSVLLTYLPTHWLYPMLSFYWILCSIPFSTTTFLIWKRSHFCYFVRLGSYLIEIPKNRLKNLKIPKFKVAIWLENSAWVFGGMGYPVCRRSIYLYRNNWHSIPRHCFWIKLAIYCHCWRYHEWFGCIQ